MTLLIIIYLIGYLVAYLFFKRLRNESGDNDWADVFTTMFFSLFSWFTVMIFVLDLCKEYITENTHRLPKPPRFL